MKAISTIIISSVQSNRSENKVWMVCIQGTEQGKNYCRNAHTAMRYAFILKQRTGISISDNCLTRLSHEIKMDKKAKADKIQHITEELAEKYSVNKVLQIADKAKKQTRKRSKAVKSTKLGLKDIDMAIEKMHVAASL